MPRLGSPTPPAAQLELDGQPIAAHAGENTACALLAAGETIFSRSIKYHRPRGPFCLTGACGQCLMRVDGVPNVPICQTTVTPGMRLERQNAFPSAQVDLFAATDWFFPRGLNHHELFAGVPIAEAVMAKVARQLAGLGRLPDAPAPPRPAATTRTVERVIVGGGAAGLAAAEVFEAKKAPWLMIERERFTGGRLVVAPEEFGAPARWSPPPANVLLGTTVVGLFEDHAGRFLAATDGTRLEKIYAQTILLANGGQPQLLQFENNDLPGVFAGRAVARMIRLHRFLPAQRIAVVGDPVEAKAIAALISSVGGIAVGVGEPVHAAHGLSAVSAVTIVHDGKQVKLDCEAIAVCAPPAPAFELARQGGAHVSWREKERLFAVDSDADGRTAAAGLFVAGELRGTMGAAAAAETGRRAALGALA